MSNALFLIYFSIVNGIETLCEVYRDLALEASGVSSAPWDSWLGCRTWPLHASSGTLSVWAPQKRLSSGILVWNLALSEDRLLLLLLDADLHGTGPQGLLLDDALTSHPGKDLPAAAARACPQRWPVLSASPSGVTRCLSSSHPLLVKEHWVVFCVACLVWQEKDTWTGGTSSVEWRMPARTRSKDTGLVPTLGSVYWPYWIARLTDVYSTIPVLKITTKIKPDSLFLEISCTLLGL